MSDNTAGSKTSIPLMPRTSSEADRSFAQIQKKDHARVNKLMKFYNKTDKLEASIYDIIEDIAIRDFNPEDPPYDSDDIQLMIHNMCAPREVLYPEFLQKVSFPYRMLRLALSIYQTDLIPIDSVSQIRLSEDEKTDNSLRELIWFQLLAGATADQIETNLIAFRQLRADAPASRSHRDRTPPKLQEMESKIHHPHPHHVLHTPPRRNVISDVRAYTHEPLHPPIAPAIRHSNVDTATTKVRRVMPSIHTSRTGSSPVPPSNPWTPFFVIMKYVPNSNVSIHRRCRCFS